MDENTTNQKKSRELDFVALLRKYFSRKKTLAAFCVSFCVIGVIVALNTPKFYTTTVILAPESNDMSSMTGKLGSVTSMLGISLNGSAGSDAIYPMLYPDLFASTDFQLELFNIPVRQEEDSIAKPYCMHLAYDGKIPFWDYPRVWILKKIKEAKEAGKPKKELTDINPQSLTKGQWEICKLIKNQIVCLVDKKTDVITISVTDADKTIASAMADTVMRKLQDHIIEYRTKKARHDAEYIESLCQQSYQEYLDIQQQYAKATDSHQDLFLMAYKSEIENLENEMQIKYTVYSETAQQLQIARQRIQERTPVFTVIQSATIAEKPSSTPRVIIVLGYILLGCILDALWVLWLEKLWRERKQKKSNLEVNE